MPQSLTAVTIHLVFSTKKREPWLRTPLRSELYAYAATVLINDGCPVLAINGTADHIHTLFNLSRERTIADTVKELKVSTSKWIKTKSASMRGFHWQVGYGAFSVSQSKVSQVVRYIDDQEAHHRGKSFQDELRALLRAHKIASDERYLWDCERAKR